MVLHGFVLLSEVGRSLLHPVVVERLCFSFCSQGGGWQTLPGDTHPLDTNPSGHTHTPVHPQTHIPLDTHPTPPMGRHPLDTPTPSGHTTPWLHTSPSGHPPRSVTAADGTYPTGMHSCFKELNRRKPRVKE